MAVGLLCVAGCGAQSNVGPHVGRTGAETAESAETAAARTRTASSTGTGTGRPRGDVITLDQVDGSLNGWITDVRYRVTYDKSDMWTGAPDGALVTIVDFTDFECPFCRRLAGNLDALREAYPDDVRIVVKHFPLNKHPRARAASEAVLAAYAQGKGFEMYDVVFDNAHELSPEDLVAYAEEVGIPDMARFLRDVEGRTYAPVVDADIEMGARFRVRSTPTFFVNGRPHSGAKSVDELKRLVEDEKVLARRLIDAGSTRDEVYARIMRAAKEKRWASW